LAQSRDMVDVDAEFHGCSSQSKTLSQIGAFEPRFRAVEGVSKPLVKADGSKWSRTRIAAIMIGGLPQSQTVDLPNKLLVLSVRPFK
jgi:hypothetical protein